jgi:hypothetical protein
MALMTHPTSREAMIRRVAANPSGPITAVLADGPLEGNTLQIEPVEGRPPKTIDVPGDDAVTYRYCLAHWVQQGMSAEYAFLYPV